MLLGSCGALSDRSNSRIWEPKASPDFSMLDMLFVLFSQLILKEWGPAMDGSCLGQPLSGGAGCEVQMLFEGLEWGWVTDISSGLKGIMKLPCQIWICPGSEGYDSYLVCLLNCLAPLIVYCLIFLEMWIWRGYMYMKVMFKKLKGISCSLRKLVFLCVCTL